MYNLAIQRLPMPKRFQKLPVDERGYPVPKFVQFINDKPDFRVISIEWFNKAVQQNLCWLCGETMGRYKSFVIGPMCAINRVNSEPPSHLECARFAVRACPFMVHPERRRNEEGLPENKMDAPGMPIARNPGVMLIWTTQYFKLFRANGGNAGVLFSLGNPTSLEWYARGRTATREEVMASINSGLPTLEAMARKEGPKAFEDFERAKKWGLALVPAE